MAQSLCKNFVHLIFSTKQRARLITDKIQPELFKYLGAILRNWESPSLIVGGVEDHVHVLFLLSKNHARGAGSPYYTLSGLWRDIAIPAQGCTLG